MTGRFNHHKFLCQDSLLRRLEEQLKRVEARVDDIWREAKEMGLSENRVYSQLYPFNRDNDH